MNGYEYFKSRAAGRMVPYVCLVRDKKGPRSHARRADTDARARRKEAAHANARRTIIELRSSTCFAPARPVAPSTTNTNTYIIYMSGTSSDSKAAEAEVSTPGAEASTTEAVPVSAALSDGLLSMLGPMVETCDSSIQAAVDSQAKVSQEIDKVAAELQGFLGSSQLPSFAPYAQRLSEVRRRANAASTTLGTVQQRLARVEAMAERLSAEQSCA